LCNFKVFAKVSAKHSESETKEVEKEIGATLEVAGNPETSLIMPILRAPHEVKI
jgi:hypothetical protein